MDDHVIINEAKEESGIRVKYDDEVRRGKNNKNPTEETTNVEKPHKIRHISQNHSKIVLNGPNPEFAVLVPEKKVTEDEYKQKISQCTNLADVIGTVKPLYHWIPPGPQFHDLFRKRSDISKLNSSNQPNGKGSIQSSSTMETTKYCNRAVAYATSSNDLAPAYYKRAVLLSSLNDPIGALDQFQLAVATRDSVNGEGGIVNKSLARNLKIKSAAFKDHAGRREELEKREEWKKEREARQKFCQELFQLKSPNPMAPAMEDFIDIKFHPNIGRHLVVTKDVPVGTTLLVEKPFVTVLDGTLKLDVKNCHHCLKRSLRCIPCPNCVFALFCDESCLLAASSSYHQFECPCLPHLRLSLPDGENTQAFYLAFKLVCKLGPKYIWEIFQNLQKKSNPSTSSSSSSSSPASTEPKIAGINPITSVYESDSYLPILHLTSNVEMVDIEFSWPATALMLTSILDVNSNFFSLATNSDQNSNLSSHPDDDDGKSQKFKDFVAETILHHFLCFCQNAYGLCEMDRMEGVGLQDKIRKNKKEEKELGYSYYGRGVFGTASLINHACVPNVTRFSALTFGTTTFIALRELKKGEELVISYIPTFNSFNSIEISRMDTSERQKDLASVYNFMCQCVACLNDWPTIIELEFVKKQFKFCGLSPLSSSSSDLANNNDSDNRKDQCLQCEIDGKEEVEKSKKKNKNCNFLAVHDKLSDHQKFIQVCHDGVMSNSPILVMNMLKAAMTFFDTHVAPPCYDLFVLQNLFDKSIELIIYFSK